MQSVFWLAILDRLERETAECVYRRPSRRSLLARVNRPGITLSLAEEHQEDPTMSHPPEPLTTSVSETPVASKYNGCFADDSVTPEITPNEGANGLLLKILFWMFFVASC
jgi:hypothetical protein